MIAKIDPHHINPQSLTQAPASKPLHVATQIFPPQSALELARNEFETQPAGHESIFVDGDGDALSEKLETRNATPGIHKPFTARGTSEGRAERPRVRAMLQHLVKNATATDSSQLDDLLAQLSNIDETSDALEKMRDSGLDAGEIALLLSSLLGRKNLSSLRRKRLEDALSVVTDEDEWALQLFNRLELGPIGKNSFVELKQLYQRATSRRTQLTQWLEEFLKLKDRKRKLKVLIRTLAFELSATGPTMDTQLSAVITDLKRIMIFLGVEDHCYRAARVLNIDGLHGDVVVSTLLEVVQQSWMHVEWLENLASRQVPDTNLHYAYARQMGELIKLMTDECFEDEEQRKMITDAFTHFQEKLSENST